VTVFDQIPAGTVEIRGASRVVGRHGHTLGHVAGLVLDDDHVISHLSSHVGICGHGGGDRQGGSLRP